MSTISMLWRTKGLRSAGRPDSSSSLSVPMRRFRDCAASSRRRPAVSRSLDSVRIPAVVGSATKLRKRRVSTGSSRAYLATIFVFPRATEIREVKYCKDWPSRGKSLRNFSPVLGGALLVFGTLSASCDNEETTSARSASTHPASASAAEPGALPPRDILDLSAFLFRDSFSNGVDGYALEPLTIGNLGREPITIDRIVLRFEYRRGSKGWAGIYWQYPDGNWGDKPGKSLVGARSITFLAKGDKGNEIVEFKAGGISGRQYADSFEVSLGHTPLSKEWTAYRIDLDGKNLASVIGGFAWSAALTDNERQLVFYITDLKVNP